MKFVEFIIFKLKPLILLALAAFTLVMGVYATRLHMDAGFFKQVPTEHPYIQTFFEYQEQVPGANLILVAVRAREGTIWNAGFLSRLQQVTEEITFLPGVRRTKVRSLWSPLTRVTENTEYGIESYQVIPSDVTPENLTPEIIEMIRDRALSGGHRGTLFANDDSGALVIAELQEIDPLTRERLDYLDLAARLESQVREPFQSDKVGIEIIGFAKFVGDMADGASDVLLFFGYAFVLTGLSVYAYIRSTWLAVLAVFCSLVSVVWQFGLLNLLGLGLDPLAVLVPFLVYAIGVSHGVQQINLIASEVSEGATSEAAARTTFSRLLVPGSMALVTDLVGFMTLSLIPIDVIRELAIMASIGVALKIVTNLIMLPLLATYLPENAAYAFSYRRIRKRREAVMRFVARVAKPHNAAVVLIIFAALLITAILQTRDRHIGDLTPGFSELWPDARYNVDTASIVADFSISVDALIVVIETPADGCIDYQVMSLVDRFSQHMDNVEGVTSVQSLPRSARSVAAIWRGGNLKWRDLPRTVPGLIRTTAHVEPSSGLLNETCTILPVIVYMDDHKATSIDRVIAAVETFAATDRQLAELEEVNIRLGMGGVGVMAATNQVIEASELPMLFWVYVAIVVLVLIAYRDWRAVICCCMPLLLATFMGYWFMTWLGIGLKVSTLPVLVLATGIGVDYAFYIYSRLQIYLDEGKPIAQAYSLALEQIGVAVVFTALTLAIGVVTWASSGLKLQADMGILLAFMFMANMVSAVLALPAFAVMLERLFPRPPVTDALN
ncbi:MAG: MMPL family transporter [Parvibaculaceae bacterium]